MSAPNKDAATASAAQEAELEAIKREDEDLKRRRDTLVAERVKMEAEMKTMKQKPEDLGKRKAARDVEEAELRAENV